MNLKKWLIILIVFYSQSIFPLGRLFMTQEKRVQLMQRKSVVQSESSETPTSFAPQSIYLNGFVKPKHGASTIWINGQIRKSKPDRGYYVRHWVSRNNKISIDLNKTETRVALSPGQVLDLDNLSVKEVYAIESPENSEYEKVNTEKIEADPKPSVLQKAIKLNQAITAFPDS